MPLSSPLPICLAVQDREVRRGAVEALFTQGYDLVLADTLGELVERAQEGVALAIVDPELPQLGAPALERLRAVPALHRCPLIVLDEGVRGALRPGAAPPDLVRFMVEVHTQLAGRALVDLLHRASATINAAPELEATMDAVLASLAMVLTFDTGTLFVLEGAGRLQPCAAHGYELAREGRRSFEAGEGVVGWVVANRVPTIVGDSAIDDRFEGRERRTSRSLLAVPMIAGDRVLGAISLVRRSPAAPFSDTELIMAATIGNGAAVALENARRYEQERALAARLDQVDQLYAQEHALVAELQRKIRVYASVVSTVSHELKTPLFGIQGFAQLLLEEGIGPDDVREFAAEIRDNALRLTRYADRILSEDGLQRGRVTLEIGEVSLRPLVDGVLRSLAATVPQTHRLDNEVPADLAPVCGDHDKIVQIMTNLVGNAVKYSPAGGRVRVFAQADGDMAELVVEDEGVGVPVEERSRVFERFSRITTPQTRGISGTGIGLSIVRGLVELHGGSVWVDDAPVRGSRFHVRLPFAVPSPPVAASLPEVA